ncbi:MAG: zinc carboxypeptidase [Ignavibacteria bacterium]|nr:zinc carboxypeptidase [Ignavibacteria bacterium]
MLLALLLFPICLPAQVSLTYYLPGDVTYDRAIPMPKSHLGFEIGEWHIRPDQIVSYMSALAAAANRISIEQYGTTYEQRPLVLLTITSPENHKRIQLIKEQRKALSDPARASSINPADMPLVVWMGYSVHGNEPSGSNAAPLVAYYLAAAQGPWIDKLLQETVILIDPSINPDGLSRFAHWANIHKGNTIVADPSHREHNEAWPGGRFNHYWFDLNRDWMPLQHPESRARVAKFHEWMPNVLTDHHEMGTNSTFFFQPGIPSRNNPHTPTRNTELTEMIAKHHAKALDAIGSLYYSKEFFDDFYIGKGSSYPDVTGSLGILFEQASSRGHAQEGSYGVVEFPFTIRNQFTVSLSTLKGADAHRKELMSYQRDFFATALKEGEKYPVKAFVFGGESDQARVYHFLDLLRRHQIVVHELAKDVRIDGHQFRRGNAYVVPVQQTHSRLIMALFERRTQFQDSLFYDISSWSLPYAFGFLCGELKTSPADLLGKKIDAPTFPTANLLGGRSSYAYAFEWNHFYAPRALYRLLRSGIKALVASQPFVSTTSEGSKSFGRGTIVVPLGIQRSLSDSIHRIVRDIPATDAVPVYGLQTGLSTEGIALGSSGFDIVPLPKIMIVAGAGASPTEVGEVWHMLDHRFGMEASLVEPATMNRIDLSRYTSIVMVSGNYGAIDSSGRAALRQWIERGGTLVAFKSAAEWAIQNRLASARMRRPDPGRRDTIALRRPYDTRDEHAGAERLSGAIFRIAVDRTHPLFFGYQDSTIGVFRSSSLMFDPSPNPYATPAVYGDKPMISGYIHPTHEKSLRNSAALLVSSLRSGRTIISTDNLNFRSFWYGTNKVLLNALFFGSTIRSTGGGMFEPPEME